MYKISRETRIAWLEVFIFSASNSLLTIMSSLVVQMLYLVLRI